MAKPESVTISLSVEVTDIKYVGDTAVVGVKVTEGDFVVMQQAFKLTRGATLGKLKQKIADTLKDTYQIRKDTQDIVKQKGKKFQISFDMTM